MLIWGADGFIGRNALEYFKGDYDITATLFTEPKLPPVEGIKYVTLDLREENTVKDRFKDSGFDVVIQAAATTTGSKDVVERPYLHVTDNVVMNAWIFREATLNNVGHVLFPSCTVMYQPKEEAQSETDWSPSDEIYSRYFGVGNMKVFNEKMCDFYSRLGSTKFTAFRHSNVYGPYDKFDFDKCHVVPAFVRKVIEAEQELEIWGTGKAKRDVIYIDDLIKAYRIIMDKMLSTDELAGKVINIGTEQDITVNDLAKLVVDTSETDIKTIYGKPRPGEVKRFLSDSSYMRSLGWEPEVSMEEGMKKYINWRKERNK